MAKQIEKNNKKYFQCEICGFFYKDKKSAQKCENLCEKYTKAAIWKLQNML